MSKVLFIPLNTNHVFVFQNIIRALRCRFEALCHDRISEAERYHTESLLMKKGLPYKHMPRIVRRSAGDPLPLRILGFYKMRQVVKEALDDLKPSLIVLAIDNDPIASVFLDEARRRDIRAVLVQEALIRPGEYVPAEKCLSDYFYGFLRLFNIYLNYTQYAAGGCDKILVSGRRAMSILNKAGVPSEKLQIIGMPKYDGMIEETATSRKGANDQRTYLFAASTSVAKDDKNVTFLKKLVQSADDLGIHLIVKLHPRSLEEPEEICSIIGRDGGSFEVVKEGDDTLDILKTSDGLITVSSTVVLEALVMDKECIVANYLAGKSCLEYDEYDAVHTINDEGEIHLAMENSLYQAKSSFNKKRLLDDELFALDGMAGTRAARIIESMA